MACDSGTRASIDDCKLTDVSLKVVWSRPKGCVKVIRMDGSKVITARKSVA